MVAANRPVRQAACIGAGVIGAGWAARLVENSIDVAVFDPAPTARQGLEAVLANADRAYAKLTMAARPVKGRVQFAETLEEACTGADWIVESVPESLEMKRDVIGRIDRAASPEAIIASSTSGQLPSRLQQGLLHPGRLIVAHPFVPVYLLPAVEIVAGKGTERPYVEKAIAFLAGIGMHPIELRKEIDAFVADRLLEAMWRESLWLIRDGICSTGELDDIIRHGFGLRLAQMGLFESYRLGGGEAGMNHFLKQFGPSLQWPWSRLTDVPELDDKLVDRIARQSDEQSGGYGHRELERIRDDNLIAILQALKANEWGAGTVLATYEKKMFDAGAAKTDGADFSRPVLTLSRRVPPDWTDYNNHMNEARYLQCFGDATDAFMRMMGLDAAYVESGMSFFTVETHIRHLKEVRVNEPIHAETQLIDGSGRKMHLFHRLHHANGELLATGEHLLLHVSLKERATCDPAPHVAKMLRKTATLHAGLPVPEGLGRHVGERR